MIRKLCFILICAVALNASSFNEKIINIIGYERYSINKGLIDHIFAKKSTYYLNGKPNYIAIMQRLKDNGLLNISLNEPQNITITFRINHDPIKSLKIITDSLKTLGFYHYFTKHLVYDENQYLTWVISLKAEAAIDPLMLSKELFKNNCSISDIKKEGYVNWMYELDTSDSILSKAKLISKNERVDFRKPLRPYLLKNKNGNKLIILSKPGNQWFPQVVFYDRHLNILNITEEDKKSKSLRLTIPKDTSYIKIDDLYTLANIKRGLSVIIKE